MSQEQGSGELLSVFDPEVTSTIENTLRLIPDVTVLHRLSRAAGRRDWYLVHSLAQFRQVVDRGRPADSYSIFLKPELPVRGVVDPLFTSTFERLLAEVEVPKTEVIMGEIVQDDPLLHDAEGWSPNEIVEARHWLQEHWGQSAAAGLHPDLFSPKKDAVLTAYVPDGNGLVRRGIY